MRRLIFASLYAAMSIILGKYLSFTALTLRISFENLPLLASGMMLGPVWGGIVGLLADIIGCLLVGYDINPIITAGAVSIGVIAGLMPKPKKNVGARVALSVSLSHLVGSVLIKSLGFYVYYGTPYFAVLVERLGVYSLIAAAEVIVLITLFSNKGIKMLAENV